MRRLWLANAALLAVGVCILAGCSKEPRQRKIKLAEPSGTAQPEVRRRTEATLQLATGERKTIVVTYFDNLTGDRDLEWLRTGITDMLIADLSQSHQLTVVSHEGLVNILRRLGKETYATADVRVAAMVAREAKAEAWLTGTLQKRGDSLRIEAKLYDAQRGELLRSDSVSGAGLERVFTMVDELTRKVKDGLQLSLRDARERALAVTEVTTSSVAAYRHYIAGFEQQNKLYFQEAVAEYQKAVALDSAFTSAYLQLAYSFGALGQHQAALQALATGVRHADRASEKERTTLLALYHMLSGNVAEAFNLLERAVPEDPYDKMLHFQLGSWSYGMGWYDRAIDELKRVIEIDPQFKLAYNTLAYAYAARGRYEEAASALKRYAELAPDEPNPLDSIGEIYLMMGKNKKALQMFRKALQVNPKFYHSTRHIAIANLEMGYYDRVLAAVEELKSQAPVPETRADVYVLSAAVCALQGRKAEALAHLDSVRAWDSLSVAYPYMVRVLEVDSTSMREYDDEWFGRIAANFPMVMANPNLFLSSLVFALRFDVHAREFAQLLAQHALMSPESGPSVSLAAVQPAMIYLGYVREMIARSSQFDPRMMAYAPDLGALYWTAYGRALLRSPAPHDDLLQWTQGYAEFAARSDNRSYELAAWLSAALVHRRAGEEQKAEAILRALGFPGEEHYLVLGPFDNLDGFNRGFIRERATSFPATVRHKGQIMRWRSAGDDLADGFVDLWSLLGRGLMGVAYLRLEFRVPTRRQAQLRFGYRTGLRVWLNGEQVWYHNGSERASLDGRVVPVQLRAGRNVLLLKSTQRVGEWGFYLRITDEQGHGFEDIEYLTP
ncbi:MAG: tetratricopeptide repeat protein [candidate division KSB1 bacterium]|nr:tetratricopeptide repeat protein [candidate division KSB1 bacterium]MDZ7386211.1 tetratricopeptide repeat protein [candidate division KSB1 bacterium]MDZ7391740.1 tetratricopeptide repeat protein [candidate division KSB1 bacterium]MDZ7412835.1 tetratricopeptide repeat protein [candidate division KSB1 bacterium]